MLLTLFFLIHPFGVGFFDCREENVNRDLRSGSVTKAASFGVHIFEIIDT